MCLLYFSVLLHLRGSAALEIYRRLPAANIARVLR
jgi:hypothetical protein